MTSIIPYSLGQDLATGNVDLDTHSFKLMILSSGYTPSKSHAKRSDLTNEVTGTGDYVAGGKAITFSVSRSNGVTSAAPSTVTWTNPNGFSGRYAACCRDRGGAASADELVFVADFLTDKPATGLQYQVSFSTALTITVP